MRKALKWTLMGLGSVILVLGAVLAYVAATFNPNDYPYRATPVRGFGACGSSR